MSHEQIWAPWRLAYVQGAKPVSLPEPVDLPPDADPACFLCRAAAATSDRENLVVARSPHSLSVLNRFPYNNGHLLVAPWRHIGRLDQLTPAEHLAALAAISHWVQILEQQLNAEGFNVGLNLGRVAGAGLPGHLHWHVVPRWNGDTNFMPVLAGVDIIPQSLGALWEVLSALPPQTLPAPGSPP